MRKIGLVIAREYLTRVKKKSFVITTLLIPIGFGIFTSVMIFITNYSSETINIVAIDKSGLYENKIPDRSKLYIAFKDTSAEYLKENYKQLGFDGFLYIPKFDINRPRGFKYFSEKQIGLETKSYLEQKLEEKIERARIRNAGLDQQTLDHLKVDLELNTIVLGEDGEKSGNEQLATVFGYIMGFTIYMVLIIYGTLVMRGVMEEKNNRIVEVIISSIKPFQLMLGKVVGIALVGLTQFLLWGILITVISTTLNFVFIDKFQDLQTMANNPAMAPNKETMEMALNYNQLQNINYSQLLGGFVFYFLGGYFLYASLFAAVGSLINDQTDSQSLTFPITLPIIISMFIMMTIVKDPNNALATWASMIPLTSPIVMPARIPFGVPTWQLVVSGLSLIGGFIFSIWLASKIYRTGILMYGKKITVKEIGKWLFFR